MNVALDKKIKKTEVFDKVCDRDCYTKYPAMEYTEVFFFLLIRSCNIAAISELGLPNPHFPVVYISESPSRSCDELFPTTTIIAKPNRRQPLTTLSLFVWEML